MKYDCIIVGAGASGLMLAAKKKVNKGLILEGTSSAGKKLLMTGGGRCNLTHAGSIKDFVSCYGEAGRIIRKLLYKHSNTEFIDWLNDIGLETTKENERFYPKSMKAAEVRDILFARAKENGWEIKTNSKVHAIKLFDTKPNSINTNDPNSSVVNSDANNGWLVRADEQYLAENVVLATGGITYPETGSDGSMFDVVQKLGVDVTPLKPALSAIEIKDYPYQDLAGVSLADVTVTAFNSDPMMTCKGKAARLTGDLLFTHNGFSGPVILNLSKYMEVGEAVKISYNKEADELPKSLRKALENRSKNATGEIKTTMLARLLESDDFVVKSIDENGIVTSGGISLDELDLTNMQIKNLPGLYAIGESIDADGTTGGYNLQLCYSTAATVADSL